MKKFKTTTLIFIYAFSCSALAKNIESDFITAATNGNIKVVKTLLKAGVNINHANKHGSTALMQAIKQGYLSVVKHLIKEGADINQTDEYQNTPLILAVGNACPISKFSGQAQTRMTSRWKEREKIIQVLLQAGSNINHANKCGNTALIIAIRNHDIDTVKKLLKFPEITTGSFFGFGKKPINHANKDGDTAIIIAIKCIRKSYISGDKQSYHTYMNSKEILNTLLKVPGIDLYHTNKNGLSAIDLFKIYKLLV